MKYYSLLIIMFCLTISCRETKSTDKKSVTPEQPMVIAALPSVPTELMEKIFIECDFVDYIFYELPFSMSYDKKSTIQSALSWVSQNTNIPTSGCKALGRMIFQKKGEIMIEAEIYVSETCSYYKWIKDGKPVYNNLMSPTGINHYMGIIKQFEKKAETQTETDN